MTALAPAIDDARVADALRELVTARRTDAVQHDGAYAELWSAIDRSLLLGKRVRPAVFLAAYRELAPAGTRPDDGRAAVDVACALELLHAAFLVHDDIIDRDHVRRGEPNVVGHGAALAERAGADERAAAGYGLAAGVIAGDLLLSAALTAIGTCDADAPTRTELLTLADRVVADTAAGEHADVWYRLGVEHADAERVLRTIELKTARYSFQLPLEAAAVLAGAGAERRAQLREIGRGLGIVYQLRDDVLGTFGAPDATGKSDTGDLREGTQTLLVVLARTSPEWRDVAHRLGDESLDEAGAQALRDAMRRSGALDRVEARIRDEHARVRRDIEAAGFGSAFTASLVDLLDRCAEREG